MIDFLASKIFKGEEDLSNSEKRVKYGMLCGGVGIGFNILLFCMKLIIGIISGAVSIIADAINNLGDAGSSIIMLVGFKMSGKKPDPEHPFGHGRIEYITGLIVSMLIILMGFELVISSVEKIIHPEQSAFSVNAIVILVISILIKLYMYRYNMQVSKEFDSATMKATALDSVVDAISTTVVLFAALMGYYAKINIDGWCGLLVSLFILYTGFESAKDTIDPLLGSKPDPEYVKAIEKYVSTFDGIVGMHDLVIHDYGPGRMMISFHAEVPADGDIIEVHDTIDNIEKVLNEKLNCHSVIHMDPIVVNDEKNDRMKRLCNLIVKSVDESLMIHDFRMVTGPTHTNLVFDVVLPYTLDMTEEELIKAVCEKVEQLPGNHFAVVNVDRPMV